MTNAGTMTAATIYEALVRDGYYKSTAPVSRAEYHQILARFAEEIDPLDIRIGLKHPRLGAPNPIGPHNDCNYFADGLSWYCGDDGDAGARLYVCEMAPLERTLSESDLEHLSGARVSLMRQRVAHTTIARWERGRPILFCPLGSCSLERDSEESRSVVHRFYQRVRELGTDHRLRGANMDLRTGQFLIVDDRRFVHGREALPADSSRTLHRSYLLMRERESWLQRTVAERPFGSMQPGERSALTDRAPA